MAVKDGTLGSFRKTDPLESYRQELAAVVPAFGLFAAVPAQGRLFNQENQCAVWNVVRTVAGART
jgi:hypothetical protein